MFPRAFDHLIDITFRRRKRSVGGRDPVELCGVPGPVLSVNEKRFPFVETEMEPLNDVEFLDFPAVDAVDHAMHQGAGRFDNGADPALAWLGIEPKLDFVIRQLRPHDEGRAGAILPHERRRQVGAVSEIQ